MSENHSYESTPNDNSKRSDFCDPASETLHGSRYGSNPGTLPPQSDLFQGRSLPVFAPGQRQGDFTIDKPLGIGGMSRVYQATDQSGDRYAIKVPIVASPWASDQLKREFRVSRSVRSDSAIRIHSAHQFDDFVYLIEDHIDGKPFHSWIRDGIDRGELPDLSRIRQFLVALSRCLVDVHAAQVVHRDIKPSNILIDEHGQPTLIDFGLATWIKTVGGWNSPVVQPGTFRYMAPELLLYNQIDFASDMYALGRCLFYGLAGRLPSFDPFAEPSLGQNCWEQKIVEQLPSGTPQDLIDLCTRLHQLDPAERPTALEVYAELAGELPPATANNRANLNTIRRKIQAEIDETPHDRGGFILIPMQPGTSHQVLRHSTAMVGRNDINLKFWADTSSDEDIPCNAIDPLVSNLTQWLQHLDPLMRRAWSLSEKSEIRDLFPMLYSILKPGDRSVEASALHGARAHGLSSLGQLLASLADERLVILTIEHLEQADDMSWQILSSIVGHMSHCRLFIIAGIDGSNSLAIDRANQLAKLSRQSPPASQVPLAG